MKQTELRLGNLVNYRGKIIEITSLIGKPIGNGAADEFEPIPLTPEILTEWCGFKQIEDGFEVEVFRQTYRLHLQVTHMVGKPNEEDWILLWEEDVGCGFNFLQYIYSLHQLQNLIFFTNTAEKELEIKIPVKA